MYACIKDLQIDSDTDFPNRNNIAFHNGKGKKKKKNSLHFARDKNTRWEQKYFQVQYCVSSTNK